MHTIEARPADVSSSRFSKRFVRHWAFAMLFCIALRADEPPISVCAAVRRGSVAHVVIRGLAVTNRDGITLIDKTCPIPLSPEVVNPASISVGVNPLDDTPVARVLKGLARTRDSKASYQLTLEGRLECVEILRFVDRAGPFANGYGSYGWSPCLLKATRVRAMQKID